MTTHRAAIVGLSIIGAEPPPKQPIHPALGMAWPHSHAEAYAALSNVDLVAVCDIVPELLSGFRANFGEVWPNTHEYTDYRKMLEQERIDILSVVTPDHLHAQIVVDATESGVRGIFCEKPIATSLGDADRMIAACERNSVTMSIDHSRRMRPHWNAALAELGDGPLGKVRRIFGTLGGRHANLFYNATHLVDTICWFAGGDPEWVVGALDEECKGYGPRYKGDGLKTPALDPGGSGLVQFDNGVRGFINCSSGMQSVLELQVFAEHGHLRIDDVSAEAWTMSPGYRGMGSAALKIPLTQIAETAAGIADLIEAVEHGREPMSPPREARKALEILLAILQSDDAGNVPVRFPVADK